jgi:four helix bundle protein
MHNFRKLAVWNRSVDVALRCYRETERFPSTETYGLISQIRRSAVSIASNIAEGCSRPSKKEFARFLQIAYGSGSELETQLVIARRVGMGNDAVLADIIGEIGEIRSMLYTLMHNEP